MGAKTTTAETATTARLVNARAVPVEFYLEPWGEAYDMPPAAVFVIVARSPQGDAPLEVLVGDDRITVWAGPGTVATLWHEGAELGAGNGPRGPVPAMPGPDSPGPRPTNALGRSTVTPRGV